MRSTFLNHKRNKARNLPKARDEGNGAAFIISEFHNIVAQQSEGCPNAADWWKRKPTAERCKAKKWKVRRAQSPQGPEKPTLWLKRSLTSVMKGRVSGVCENEQLPTVAFRGTSQAHNGFNQKWRPDTEASIIHEELSAILYPTGSRSQQLGTREPVCLKKNLRGKANIFQSCKLSVQGTT